VAYCGKSHVSARINRSWVKAFLAGKTRSGWIEANYIVNSLAKAIKEKTLLIGEVRVVEKKRRSRLP
jgi:hypothetical protein